MIAYKFTMGKKGQLTCYKSDNTLNKYTGKKALSKLEHIMDFSYHSFDSMIKDLNPNKRCFSMVFVSNNHIVTFEDISKFQRNADFSIENILREIIAVINENQLQAQQLQDTIRDEYSIDVRKTKIAFLAAFSAMVVAINNYPTLKANQKDKYYNPAPLEKTSELIEVTPIEDYPSKLIIEANIGTISAPDENGIIYNNEIASFASNEKWNGMVLDSSLGVIENGPSGDYETFYDADVICDVGMDNCVKYMRDLGFDEETYPYYIREDGVRMFGDYVMVAANTEILPKGTLLETTLGTAMVVDHCENAESILNQVDVAVNWTKHLELKK